MATSRLWRVALFANASPRDVDRIAKRLHKHVPGATLRGILYETGPHPTGLNPPVSTSCLQGFLWVKEFVQARSLHWFLNLLARAGDALLRFAHACPKDPNGSGKFGLEDLRASCEKMGSSLHATPDMQAPEALDYVRGLQLDLGIAYGGGIFRPEVFRIPTEGSIGICENKLLECFRGGPQGIQEFLEQQEEVRVAIQRMGVEPRTGRVTHAATIPIDPYDGLRSLALKVSVIANDLLVRAVADFAKGVVPDMPIEGANRTFRNQKSPDLTPRQKKNLSKLLIYKPPRHRAAWSLLLRTMLAAPGVVIRNWIRRLRRRFPVVILSLHLVSDRPHRLGIPTEFFLNRVDFLRKHYRIVSLGEAVQLLERGRVDAPTLVFTFDDGYAENFVSLRAVTELRGLPATLFVSTQYLASQKEFQHDVRIGQQGFPPLTWEQTLCMSENGFEVGSHTRTHFDCASSDLEVLQSEIVGSKIDLERRLGSPVKFFSFPWGHPKNMSPQAVALARATYPYVLSSHGGVNFPNSHAKLWHLNRCGNPRSLWELELRLQSVLRS